MLQTNSVTIPQLALAAAFFCVSYGLAAFFVYPFIFSQGKWWKSQEWVGIGDRWFAHFRAGMNTIDHTKDFIAEGYEKFTKKGKTWVLPQFASRPVVILSASQISELLTYSDNDVEPFLPNSEALAFDYTIGMDLAHGPQLNVVRRQLTRRLHHLTEAVYEELVLAMKDNWQADEKEWKTVKALPTLLRIVSRAANRVFAGAELCRTPEFIESSRMYTSEVFRVGGLMKLVPKPLHPIAGPILCRGVRKHLAICSKYVVPIMRERLKHIMDPAKDPSYEAPNDALQWILEECVPLAKNDPYQLDETLMCRRLLQLNMGAIHTTSTAATNIVLDIYSSPNKEEYLAGFREECERLLRESDGKWTKDAVDGMHRIDSAVRESARHRSLGDLGMRRDVIAPNGITLSDGTHLPKGIRVAAPLYSIHSDPEFHGKNAREWDAFRYSRTREASLRPVETAAGDSNRQTKMLDQSLTKTSPEFLTFGHGRHSCPGRFFASMEIKLMIAYIITAYDIDIPGGKRPENRRKMGTNLPSPTAEIRVRLRGSKVEDS